MAKGKRHIRPPLVQLNDGLGGLAHVRKQLQAEPNSIWLYGAFLELLSRARNTEPRLAGCLVDDQGAPATAAVVGSWLGIEAPRAEQVLLKFQELGILEQTPMPSGKRPSA